MYLQKWEVYQVKKIIKEYVFFEWDRSFENEFHSIRKWPFEFTKINKNVLISKLVQTY